MKSSTNNLILFSVTDPLGRNIEVTKKTWNTHIITGHNVLYKREDLIKRIIENPAIILLDKYDDQVNNYFDICNISPEPYPDIIKIVVDFKNSTGDIITAYTIENMSTQATIIKGGVIYERSKKKTNT